MVNPHLYLLSGEGEKNSTFAGHNYKADYKYKVTTGQKADGALQIKEVRVQGDEWEPLITINLDIIKDTYAMAKERKMKAVSPYEKDHEPIF